MDIKVKSEKFFKLLPYFVILVILFLAIIKGLQIRTAIAEGSKKGPPTMAVTTMHVTKSHWNSVIRTVGNIEPTEGAVLSAEESGRISKIFQEDGAKITKGTPIIEIDASVEKAELEAAKAQSELLKKTFQRQKRLFEANAISGEEFDTADLNFKASIAQLESLRSKVDRKLIKAPFDGTLGVRRTTVGQYVRQGDPLIPLFNTDNIYVTFALSQNDTARVKIGDKVKLIDASNTNSEGSILAIDPSISIETKTALLKAHIAKPNNLTPGTFVQVVIDIDDSSEKVVIPSTSIQYAPYGDSVYVVEDAISRDGEKIKIANPQFIKIHDRRGELAAIESNLEDGTEIVTSGTFKLFPGATVYVNNSVEIPHRSDPTPQNR